MCVFACVSFAFFWLFLFLGHLVSFPFLVLAVGTTRFAAGPFFPSFRAGMGGFGACRLGPFSSLPVVKLSRTHPVVPSSATEKLKVKEGATDTPAIWPLIIPPEMPHARSNLLSLRLFFLFRSRCEWIGQQALVPFFRGGYSRSSSSLQANVAPWVECGGGGKEKQTTCVC